METKTTIQFDVLDTEMLAYWGRNSLVQGEVCTLAGAMIGSLVAPRAGTWAGGVYEQYCTAIWAIARFL